MGGKRAAVLVVVLGVLFVLASLAIAFARVMTLERDASRTRSDHVQARFCAAAGVEHALAAIRKASRRPWDGPDAAWFYRGHAGRPAGNGIPLEEATLPSFLAGSTADGNAAIASSGLGRPYSGALEDTYEPLGDTYVVRVLDAGSMIDLNAPLDPRRSIADQPLVRMLINLSRAIDPARPPITPAEAERIVAWRESLPGRRFDSKAQILAVPGPAVGRGDFRRIADFVTVHAWSDPWTVAPMDPGAVPAADELVGSRLPTGVPILAGRSPIDLNTAPREVLVAALADVQAIRVERAIDRSAGGDAWRAIGKAVRTAPVGFDQAVAVAGEILRRREADPFRGWADVRDFLDAQVGAGALTGEQAAALLANADPNTNTHRANPDRAIRREIDKFDLVVSTTEFAFQSGGVFEIESLGRVTHEGGRIRAEAAIRTVVSVYDLVRQTVQSQFARGRTSSYELAEPLFYQPRVAILTEEDLEVSGEPRILGAAGSVHSNGDLDLIGRPAIEGDATATYGYSAGSGATVGGTSGGGQPREIIPVLDPSGYREFADYVFGSDGTVRDRGGQVVGTGSFMGFTQSGNGLWSWSGGKGEPAGLLFFEGDVSVGSSNGAPWRVSFVATGSVQMRGAIQMGPAPGLGLAVLAGTDAKITGAPGSVVSGMVYAGEQIELGGEASYLGAFIARGAGHADGLVKKNRVHGNPVIQYDGDGPPLPLGWYTSSWPSAVTYPEPDASIDANGSPFHLPSWASYDGYVGVAPLTTSITVLGPIPYQDRLLARWNGGSLDATDGGGDLAMAADGAGPRIAPVAGASVGHLLPDGVYSETGAVPAYAASGNVDPVAGTLAFWIKPSWDGSATTRSHHLLALSETSSGGTRSFQLARAGAWGGTWSEILGFHFERSRVESGDERLLYSAWTPPAHRWTHVVLVWDFLASDPDAAIALYVDGAEVPGAARDFLQTGPLVDAALAEAPLAPGTLLRLGERIGNDYQLQAASAEATFDELVSLPHRVDAAWAAARHGEGRYYSGGDAWFESAELPILSGSEVLHAAWTVRYPEDWQGPFVQLELLEGGSSIASTSDPAGVPVGRRIAGPIRYRLVFQVAPHGAPLFETPFVDDVTVARAEAPRILLWEEDPS